MDVKELIKLDSHKVRGNSSLMALYIQAYEEQFGRKPNCAGCTFANDWARFVLAVKGGEAKTLTTKSMTMENTYKLKKAQGKILAYKAGGKTYRLYDNNLNEAFVIGFLTNGTEEQLKERKALFSILPEQLRMSKEEKSAELIDKTIKSENRLNSLPGDVSEKDKEEAQKEVDTANDDLSDFRTENDLIIKEEPAHPKAKKTRAKRGSKNK